MKLKLLVAVMAAMTGSYALYHQLGDGSSDAMSASVDNAQQSSQSLATATAMTSAAAPAGAPGAAAKTAGDAPSMADVEDFVANLNDQADTGYQSPNAQFSPPAAGADLFQGERTAGVGAPFHLKPAGGQSLVASDANMAKQAVMMGGKQLLNISENDDLELKTSKRDDEGNVYYKFTQEYNGVPVHGRETVVQASSKDEISLVAGEFEPGIQLDVNPGLNGQVAFNKAVDSMRDTLRGEPRFREDPSLQIYVSEADGPVLTWRSVVEYITTDEGYRVDEIFVDANSGKIVDKLPRFYSALSRSVHSIDRQCFDPNWGSNILPGREVSPNADEHAKAAYDNSGYTYWFYDNMFNRDSYDGRGKKMVSTVHAMFTTPNGGCSGDNAYFNGEQMIYGEGGSMLQNPAGALDIVAHELTHGVTFSESNLTYRNESGAINEALSDIFGAGAETYVMSGGSANSKPSGGLKPQRSNWTLGEKASPNGSMMRDMSDPVADGQSRDSYDSRYTGTQDNGGVHLNSGIMNLAFYLLSEGGVHPRGKTTNRVTGIGMEKALEIYYHANTNLFTASTNFASARTRLAQSAETLYGECSQEWHSIHESFDAVKVQGSWTPCDDGGDDGGDDNGGDDGGDDGGDNGGDTGSVSISSAKASSTYSNRYLPSNLHDGSLSTPWVSSTIYNSYQQQWVMLDLGGARSMSGMTINWDGGNFAGSYDIYVWQNGQWVRAQRVRQYRSGAADIPLQANSQYVLVTMRYGNYGRWYAIDEITLR
ncbi:Zinc metalloprotease (elastase) [Hahella chejuensis KCTC 2396]|uniref:Zinc metalloprotease (Elastase) n=1 Tax=Hahella chejuensis (strain KCTC 2396) TaxID=349521 RepID=Q2SNQ3_HAHCH|nr:M4 family metallopeptidase [Hahella chejuensis]ABC27721.1 Zinc metalloprotease (elastase) [Hahella chejuensis KCTC 2396]